MNAKDLFTNKLDTYIYLERYINDGSPSGFTDIHTTSEKTSPFTGQDRFPLLSFNDSDIESVYLGHKSEIFLPNINFAHPDSIDSEILKSSSRKLEHTDFNVSPTSSSRTMLIRDAHFTGFLKLTYDIARIGRVDRQLSLKICQSSREVTDTILKSISENKLTSSFAILLDVGAKISLLKMKDNLYEWGAIYRELKPYPHKQQNTILIPGFSLFGIDRNKKEDELLINQFIILSKTPPYEYLMNLVKMILDSYWGVVINCAFNLECHAQNCLFELDESYQINRLVYRDMDSVDKDIPLARYFGYNTNWESAPYLCFDESIYYYPIRSSYMYDFKLGEYLLSPLISVVAKKFNLDVVTIQNEIKQYVHEKYICKLPSNYFTDDGHWHFCDNTERMPNQKRKYFSDPNPKYR